MKITGLFLALLLLCFTFTACKDDSGRGINLPNDFDISVDLPGIDENPDIGVPPSTDDDPPDDTPPDDIPIEVDTTPPTITKVVPENDANEIPTNTHVLIAFSEDMDEEFITPENVYVMERGGDVVPFNLVFYNDMAVIYFDHRLKESTYYLIIVETDVKDLAGLEMESRFMSNFRTGTSADTTPPIVVSTSPKNGEEGVETITKILINFNEVIDPDTIVPEAFFLESEDKEEVEIDVNLINLAQTAELVPVGKPLKPFTLYRFIAMDSITDLAGNNLEEDYNSYFVTGDRFDTIPPTVHFSYPLSGDENIPTMTRIVITFSEEMDPETIIPEAFFMQGEDNSIIEGAVIYENRTATFTPVKELQANSYYRFVVKDDIAADLEGNTLEKVYQFDFTTGNN